MLLLRALLLWSLVSLHVVGGAALFRRFFPRESPWFGFIVPGLALVLALNFIERLVALPSLLWLLPLTSGVALWGLARPGMNWKGFRLPAGIFLASFAFTLALRCMRPDIVAVRDGVVDLSLLSCFCLGDKVPPVFNWFPLLHLSQYYTLGHYAMSVVTRLFGLDVGTGYNVSSALLSAFDCFLAAAAAWRIGRQRAWITIAAPIALECSGTGALAYFWFTTPDIDPNMANNIFTGMDDPQNHNPLWKLLRPTDWGSRRELMVPGAWSWIGSFHSTSAGQFLSLFSIWSLAEVLRRRLSNWPWICLAACPLLMVATSTWGVPLLILYLAGAGFWIWYYGLFPRDLRFVLLGVGAVAVAMAPLLLEFLTTDAMPPGQWTPPAYHTQVVEFLIMWWQVYLPWLALLFLWRRLPPTLKTVLVIFPFAFLAIEFYTVGGRPDFTGKLWGYLYGGLWVTLMPVLYRQRAWLFRGIAILIAISCLFSLIAWSQYTWLNANDVLHLEGNGSLRNDPARAPMLVVLSPLKGKTIICGKSYGMYDEPPFLAAFTGTYTYVSWSYFCDVVEGTNTFGLADRRGTEVNDLYDGKCANPLLFLREHDIAALVIYPRDKITGEVLATLKKQLAPWYEYQDFTQDPAFNAGVFVYHPELAGWPAGLLSPAPATNAPPASP